MKIRKNKNGFTLVELVVVIAILAVLASTATVATIAILNNARKVPVTEAAESLKNAMQFYVTTENSEYADSAEGVRKFLQSYFPDVTVDKTTGSAPNQNLNEDGIHIKICKQSTYKTAAWFVWVYTQYYKVRVIYNYAYTNNGAGFTDFNVEGPYKLNEIPR